MIRIAVVDDDNILLNQIKELIKKKNNDNFLIDLYSDSIAFYNNNDKWNYDIIFLDIDMPEMNGFEIAETMSLLKRNSAIVFISNLEHLVYDSLRFRPFRFIRKSRLSDDMMSALDAFIIERKRRQDIFVIKGNGVDIPTHISDIIYFESMKHDIFAKTSDNMRYRLLRERNNNITMKQLSEQYENKGFIRIHTSYLVNYRFIYVIKTSEVVLKNTEKIAINPHRAAFIRNQFQHFIITEGGT